MVKKSLLPGALMALGSALLGTIFTPSAALAGKSCNYLNTNLFMAQGYQNHNDIWVSEGWWVVEPGECVVYSDNAFTYFKISNGVAANRPLTAQEQIQTVKLCQVNDRFTVFQADQGQACGNAGGNIATFLNPGSTLEVIKCKTRVAPSLSKICQPLENSSNRSRRKHAKRTNSCDYPGVLEIVLTCYG